MLLLLLLLDSATSSTSTSTSTYSPLVGCVRGGVDLVPPALAARLALALALALACCVASAVASVALLLLPLPPPSIFFVVFIVSPMPPLPFFVSSAPLASIVLLTTSSIPGPRAGAPPTAPRRARAGPATQISMLVVSISVTIKLPRLRYLGRSSGAFIGGVIASVFPARLAPRWRAGRHCFKS